MLVHRCILLLFNCLVMSDFLWPHRLHYRLCPYPSPSPKVCPSSCPLHQGCHPVSDTLFSFCPQSFPASRIFLMSQLFTSDDQNTGTSASVLPMSIQGYFLKIDWFDLLAVQGTFRSLLQHHSLKATILWCSAFFRVQLSQPYITAGLIVSCLLLWLSHEKITTGKE